MSFILNGNFQICRREFHPPRSRKISCRSALMMGLMLVISPVMGAEDKLDNVIDAAAAANQKAAEAQQRVDALATDTKSMVDEYRQVVAKTDDLKAYNDQVERMLTTQKNELATLSERTRSNAITPERLLPLLQKMVDTLDTFVKLDAPFLAEERANRVKDLKALIELPDVGLTEKYRRVMEAYQVEAEYGRTIEAYTGELPADKGGKGRTVNFLRVGRMALMYSTLDGGESGYWDVKTKSYQPLSSEFGPEIERGLKIARKEAAPDLLKIPLPAPERTK